MRSRMVNGNDSQEGPWERRGLGGEMSSDEDSVSSEGSEASDEEA